MLKGAAWGLGVVVGSFINVVKMCSWVVDAIVVVDVGVVEVVCNGCVVNVEVVVDLVVVGVDLVVVVVDFVVVVVDLVVVVVDLVVVRIGVVVGFGVVLIVVGVNDDVGINELSTTVSTTLGSVGKL
jgi:hypothetical protein